MIPTYQKTIILSDVRPAIKQMEAEMMKIEKEYMEQLEKELNEGFYKHFREKVSYYKKNVPNAKETLRKKGKNKPPLIDTGVLAASVKRSKPISIKEGKQGFMKIDVDLSELPSYFGYNEVGNSHVPKREFLTSYIQKTANEFNDTVFTTNTEAVATLRNPSMPPTPISKTNWLSFTGGVSTKLSRFLFFALLPPTKALALVGATDDLLGLLQGRFNARTADAWVNAYIKGKAGMTSKVYRRKARRKLYGR